MRWKERERDHSVRTALDLGAIMASLMDVGVAGLGFNGTFSLPITYSQLPVPEEIDGGSS